MYYIEDCIEDYEGNSLKCAVVVSESLIGTKTKTCEKKIISEDEKIKKIIKMYANKKFACIKDAQEELEIINKNDLSKFKYHKICVSIEKIEKKKQGRPSLKSNTDNIIFEYGI